MVKQNSIQLRKSIRRTRSQLSPQQQRDAARNVARQANHLLTLKSASLVLSYVPVGGEISPQHLQGQLPKATILLPRISHYEHNTMQFFRASNRVMKNRYGIEEPMPTTAPVNALRVDAVLVPLVAFDRNGNRLGMGGGFYDRAFAHRRDSHVLHKPLLIGLAHHCQEVNSLQPEYWDVPLDVIITDQEVIWPCPHKLNRSH